MTKWSIISKFLFPMVIVFLSCKSDMTNVRKLTTNAEPGTNFKSTVVLPYIKGLFKQIPATFNQAELDDRLNAITT